MILHFLQFLGIIEQRTNELLQVQAFVATKVSLSKSPAIIYLPNFFAYSSKYFNFILTLYFNFILILTNILISRRALRVAWENGKQ